MWAMSVSWGTSQNCCAGNARLLPASMPTRLDTLGVLQVLQCLLLPGAPPECLQQGSKTYFADAELC